MLTILVVAKQILKFFIWDGLYQNIPLINLSQKKKIKIMQKFLIEFQKEIKLLSESYFFIRDLINTPANILGPNEIFKEQKIS